MVFTSSHFYVTIVNGSNEECIIIVLRVRYFKIIKRPIPPVCLSTIHISNPSFKLISLKILLYKNSVETCKRRDPNRGDGVPDQPFRLFSCLVSLHRPRPERPGTLRPAAPFPLFPRGSARFMPSEAASPTGWRIPPWPIWLAARSFAPSWSLSTCSMPVTLVLSSPSVRGERMCQ